MSKLIYASNDPTLHMEGVHKAYVKAIASFAGCTFAEFNPDVNGIDCKLGRQGVLADVGFQLKSTTDWRFDNGDLVYELDVNAYNQLIGYSERVPSFLGVMIYPPKDTDWHDITEGDFFRIRHTMYWEFLGGRTRSTNKQSVTIRIPRRKTFSASWLDDLFTALRTRRGISKVLS